MPQEIERKFLVASDSWQHPSDGSPMGQFYCQGYIATARPGQSVRLRIVGEQGYLTVKGPADGLSRAEFEYAIPVGDAREMLETLCDRPFIEKMRYRVPIGNLVWEIDEFQGENAGLVIAEVELTSEDQTVTLPEWVGEEVSGDAKYYNSSLVKHPYTQWR
ncbi:MAG: CYTH domain-containing protein [Cyanobacteria bacterium J06623_5]